MRVEPTVGANKAWIPLPTFEADDWQRPGNVTWTGNAKVAERVRDPKYGAEMLRVEWAADQQIAADRGHRPGPGAEPRGACRARARSRRSATPSASSTSAATELLPIDGLVKETAEDIVKGKTGRRRQGARALRMGGREHLPQRQDPGLRRRRHHRMIKTGNLNGKCADLNALFVGMARSVGLPARDVYGIRVVPSQFGFKALGAGSENVTKAQHCRAEVWLPGSGWTPVDPADVRKVVLEEPPGNLAMTDPKVLAARKALFGAWEGNWVAFNTAHDVKLPGSKEPAHPVPDVPAGREQGAASSIRSIPTSSSTASRRVN